MISINISPCTWPPPCYMYIMYRELLYMSFYALFCIKNLYVNGFTMHFVVMWGFTEIFYICTHDISNIIFIIIFLSRDNFARNGQISEHIHMVSGNIDANIPYCTYRTITYGCSPQSYFDILISSPPYHCLADIYINEIADKRIQ